MTNPNKKTLSQMRGYSCYYNSRYEETVYHCKLKLSASIYNEVNTPRWREIGIDRILIESNPYTPDDYIAIRIGACGPVRYYMYDFAPSLILPDYIELVFDRYLYFEELVDWSVKGVFKNIVSPVDCYLTGKQIIIIKGKED